MTDTETQPQDDLAEGIETSFLVRGNGRDLLQPDDRRLLRRIENIETELRLLRGTPLFPIYPVRKGATPSQFLEVTPGTGNTLVPMVSGGRNVTSDTAPAVPVDLGVDDSVLMEIPTPGKIRTVRIAGGGVKRVRYIQTPIHAFQQTFKQNPTVDADWETIVELDPCSTTAPRTGNLFNPLGLVSSNYLYEESITVNLGAPITNTVKIDTADTSDNGGGAGTIELLTESLAFSIFRIKAKAIASVPKTQIRIFVSYNGGTTKFWIGDIDVPATEVSGIQKPFEGIWTPEDEVNGMVMPDTASIWVSTYDDATFNVTIEGSRII